MGFGKWTPYRGLILAVAVAAVLQILLIARSPSITADGIVFTSIAKELEQSPVETFRTQDQHPAYPAMLLGMTRLVQWFGYRAEPESWMLAGQAIGFVCGLLSIGVVWLFARDLFDAQAANLAALTFAVLPVPRWNASDAMSDTPHMLFFLLAAWLASSAMVDGRLWKLIAAGAASGIAYWIRPEGLEVALVAIGFLVCRGLIARWQWKRLAVATAALAGSTMIVAVPYMALAGKLTSKQLQFAKVEPGPTYLATLAEVKPTPPSAPVQSPGGEPTPAPSTPPVAQTTTPDAAATAATLPPAAPETAAPAVAAPAPPAAPEVERRYSASLVLRVVGKGIKTFTASIFQGFKFIFLPFYLLGHIELYRRRDKWVPAGFVMVLGASHICVLIGVYVLSGYIAHRHVLPLVALGMPITGLGICYVASQLAPIRPRRRLAVEWAMMGACAALVLPYTARPFCREFIPVIEATRWVEAHADPGDGIVCNSPYVGFYGKLPVAVLDHRAGTVREAVAYAPVRAQYDFVVLHVNAHGYLPQWIDEVAANYQQVCQFDDPGTGGKPKKVLVFQAKHPQLRQASRGDRS